MSCHCVGLHLPFLKLFWMLESHAQLFFLYVGCIR